MARLLLTGVLWVMGYGLRFGGLAVSGLIFGAFTAYRYVVSIHDSLSYALCVMR